VTTLHLADFQVGATAWEARSGNGNPTEVTPQAAACDDAGQAPVDLATPPS
jgi:hypothetical protein